MQEAGVVRRRGAAQGPARDHAGLERVEGGGALFAVVVLHGIVLETRGGGHFVGVC